VNRRQKAPDGLVADKKRNESQHDGAAEPGEITQLAGAEAEARVARVLAGEGVGPCGNQHRNRVGRHVQAVRDQREGAEGDPTADLQHHHRGAQPDDRPRATLVARMARAEEDVRVLVFQPYGVRSHAGGLT
jgi:hypothetical protein